MIKHLHKCDSTWVESVPVKEVLRGQTILGWYCEVFDLTGHPKAKRALMESQRKGDTGERFVTVLEIPPVESPETAVKVAIAAEVRQRNNMTGLFKIEFKRKPGTREDISIERLAPCAYVCFPRGIR